MSDDIFNNVKPILRVKHLRLKFEDALQHQQVPIAIVGEFVRADGPDKFIIKNSKGMELTVNDNKSVAEFKGFVEVRGVVNGGQFFFGSLQQFNNQFSKMSQLLELSQYDDTLDILSHETMKGLIAE